jgi:hypothetical protein
MTRSKNRFLSSIHGARAAPFIRSRLAASGKQFLGFPAALLLFQQSGCDSRLIVCGQRR